MDGKGSGFHKEKTLLSISVIGAKRGICNLFFPSGRGTRIGTVKVAPRLVWEGVQILGRGVGSLEASDER